MSLATLPHTPGRAHMPAAKLGLLFFMLVASAIFFLLTIAYLARAQLADWQSLGGESWRPLSASNLPWFNTLLLLIASLALQRARNAMVLGKLMRARHAFIAGGVLAIGFVVGQLALWQQLTARGFPIDANPANSFFYLITALHGLHLIGGIVAWGSTVARFGQGALITARLQLRVELCSLYWHFLFVVWLAMFALLSSPRETLDQLAGLCGLR
jgi:cytochrome c oxidase subunit 3